MKHVLEHVGRFQQAYLDYGGCDYGKCDYGECEYGGTTANVSTEYGECDPNPNPYQTHTLSITNTLTHTLTHTPLT